MTHRHSLKCLDGCPHGKSPASKHRHTEACKNRWGSILCKENIRSLVRGVRPVVEGEGKYQITSPIYGPGIEQGKTLLERIPVTRNRKLVGSIFYSPDSYPQSPWQGNLSILRMSSHFKTSSFPDPYRNPGANAFDVLGTSAQDALLKIAKSAEGFVRWAKEQDR